MWACPARRQPVTDLLRQSEAALVLHFARTLHRLRPDEPDTVLLAGALAMRAPQWGHICFAPTEIARTVVVDDGAAVGIEDLPWPNAADWADALAHSELVSNRAPDAGVASAASATDEGALSELRPLVWDGTRLYLQRYWAYEENVALRLMTRLGQTGETIAEEDLQLVNGSPSQIVAATSALTRPLTVITGGPGTGKTFPVAAVVATLLHRDQLRANAAAADPSAAARDYAPINIALAAPTGKAAQRLTETLRATPTDPSLAETLQHLEAVTIHRLLGAHPNGFRHTPSNPLPADVVIVDEMSMVSLPLMSRLLDAVRPDARLVLVGDPHQLASVEAGSVLRDLVDGLPAAPAGPMCALQQVFRQKESSPIIPLAEAAREGNAAAVLELLRAQGNALSLVDPSDDAEIGELISSLAAQADAVVAAAAAPDVAHALLGESRVLAASRQGPNGRRVWNSHIERRLGGSGGGASRTRLTRWYEGRPVIVTENDYLNRLMNGDVGIVMHQPPAPGGETTASGGESTASGAAGVDRVVVAFPRGGEMVRVAPSRLHSVDTVWAMTIHKSQGSEFNQVVVALPEAPSPLLTRELVYTAITRARVGVTVVASEAALRSAMQRSISRSSGLGERLVRLRPPSEPQQLSLWD